jgi:hypothetical protein
LSVPGAMYEGTPREVRRARRQSFPSPGVSLSLPRRQHRLPVGQAPLSLADPDIFHAIRGSVNFLYMRTRMDIAFPISVISRHQGTPFRST